MIKYIEGDIFESKAEALINTVNTVGVMGKGIALQFKKAFPNNYKSYVEACKKNEIQIGKVFIVKDSNLQIGAKYIINFPTKKHWRNSSEYHYIESGLDDLIRVLKEYKIKSVAIPPLGAGNGGLEWEKVKIIIEHKLKSLDVEINIFEPTLPIEQQLKKERVKLTDARALLLYVLYDLVMNGEYVSEFSSEKVCYFLQRFGAEKYFNLEFTPKFYGPYSGKVRYVLNVLNGSYLKGYSGMNKKPFEPLMLISDGFHEVKSHVENNPELNMIARKTTHFLNGFYSDFALELLSSIDFITSNQKSFDFELINKQLEEWSERKRSLFSNPRYIQIAIKQLQSAEFNKCRGV
jgi:O-acetyl-ADP-ribose deacetylase (regulator of RNase III)